MGMRSAKLRGMGLAGLAILFVLVSFQNCSQVGFVSGPDLTHSFSTGNTSASMVIEGGRSATNKHLLNITIVGLNPYTMDQMRIANKKDMVGNTFPASAAWQPFAAQFQYDLGADYASDGTKDNEKTLVVEVKPKSIADVQVIDPFSGQILLDTVPPSLALNGVLKNGLNGATYTKGQTMAIDWTAADVPAPTGSSSGMDPNASIQMTWSDPDDCSKIDSSQLPLLPDDASSRQFVWPKDSRLENFYICVFAVDRAGNKTTGLSQPMNDIWQVIAGDNNQGNGGSWKAANVRFGYAQAGAVDSKDNLYIYDSDFSTIRKVATDGTITSYLGNGQTNSSSMPSDQYNSALPTTTLGMSMDSKDRLYYGSGRIYRFTVNETDHSVKTEYLVAGGLNHRVAKFSDGVEYLLFSTAHAHDGTIDYAYLYKVPLSKFDSISLPATEDSLAGYRIAGSGQINHYTNSNTGWIPRQQAAASAILPEIRSIAVDSNDDIYFAGTTDGSGYMVGEHALFLLRAGQLYKLTSEGVGPYWANEIEILTRADGSRYVVAGGHEGLMAVSLNLSTLPVTADLPVQRLTGMTNTSSGIYDCAYGVVLMHQRVSNEPIFYGFDQTTSKVLKYQGLSLVDTFGRNVYDPTNTDALTTMVNVPSGIVEDTSNNIYFFEALSDVIRKLDPTGHLTLFSGTPFKSSAPANQAGKTSAQALLAGESYNESYRFPMGFDDNANRIILGLGSTGELLSLPLSPAQTVNRLTFPALAPTSISSADLNKLSESTDKNFWPIFDIHMRGSEILADRFLTVVPYREQIISYNGGSAMPLIGNEINRLSFDLINGLSTSVFTGNALSVSFDERQPTAVFQNQVYLSNAGGILKYDGTNVTQVVGTPRVFDNFDITTDAANRKILVGTKQNSMTAAVLYPDGSSKTFNLCMPGSFPNAQFVRMSRDGNSLLISDTSQRRVLRYWLKSNGDVHLFQKPTSGTACVPITL